MGWFGFLERVQRLRPLRRTLMGRSDWRWAPWKADHKLANESPHSASYRQDSISSDAASSKFNAESHSIEFRRRLTMAICFCFCFCQVFSPNEPAERCPANKRQTKRNESAAGQERAERRFDLIRSTRYQRRIDREPSGLWTGIVASLFFFLFFLF